MKLEFADLAELDHFLLSEAAGHFPRVAIRLRATTDGPDEIPEATWNPFPRLTHAVELDLAVNRLRATRVSRMAKVLPQMPLKTL